jgi:hypothetical protein
VGMTRPEGCAAQPHPRPSAWGVLEAVFAEVGEDTGDQPEPG